MILYKIASNIVSTVLKENILLNISYSFPNRSFGSNEIEKFSYNYEPKGVNNYDDTQHIHKLQNFNKDIYFSFRKY